MKGRGALGLVVALAAIATVLTIGSGAGGAPVPAKPDLAAVDVTSVAAIKAHLRARGLDPARVVIQRGVRNYAGPRCPGKGWTCTKGRQVFQVASRGGANVVACGPEGMLSGPGQTCTIIQSGPGDNTAHCTLSTSAVPTAFQHCDITQHSDTGGNTATVDMRIRQTGGNVQQAEQRLNVEQDADSGDNTVTWRMETNQVVSRGFSQTQDARLSATIDQSTNAGDNVSNGNQILDERARRTASTAISQCQNGNPSMSPAHNSACAAAPSTGPDTEAFVHQVSASGTNTSRLRQRNALRATADAGAANIFQTQGTGKTGGIDADVNQKSPVDNESTFDQIKGYHESAFTTRHAFQEQFDGLNCCSDQIGPGTIVVNQLSGLTSFPGALQELAINLSTTAGTECRATGRGHDDEDQATFSSSGDETCHEFVSCSNADPNSASRTPFSVWSGGARQQEDTCTSSDELAGETASARGPR